MARAEARTTRKPRADTIRNRERLLTAASEIFRTEGGNATLESVARHSGLGVGTLYRHFPTREALFEAVYRREVDGLAALARSCDSQEDPVLALRNWTRAFIGLVATKQGMLTALALAVDKSSEIFAYSQTNLTTAMALLLDRAHEAGRIRGDVTPDDYLYTLIGMCMVRSQPGWEGDVMRLADIFIDGLSLGEGTAG